MGHVISITRGKWDIQTPFKETQYYIYIKRARPIDVSVSDKMKQSGLKGLLN